MSNGPGGGREVQEKIVKRKSTFLVFRALLHMWTSTMNYLSSNKSVRHGMLEMRQCLEGKTVEQNKITQHIRMDGLQPIASFFFWGGGVLNLLLDAYFLHHENPSPLS